MFYTIHPIVGIKYACEIKPGIKITILLPGIHYKPSTYEQNMKYIMQVQL